MTPNKTNKIQRCLRRRDLLAAPCCIPLHDFQLIDFFENGLWLCRWRQSWIECLA